MARIRWRREMAVDHGPIDDDHRHLIDIINSFSYHRSRGRQGLAEAVDCLYALKFYAETHFAREEHLQRLVAYPGHQLQHDEHGRLMESLDDMIARARRAMSESDALDIVRELGELLRRWLLDHIIVLDLRMKPYAARMKSYAGGLSELRAISRPVTSSPV